MNGPLRIFVGWDDREREAYHVLAQSIIEKSSCPVAIIPLKRSMIERFYWRTRGPTESTEFSLSRFIVPTLCGFNGPALFMDCDMLCMVDICEIWLHILANPDKAVLVCQHDYAPKSATKFLNQPQTVYPRKNWSSLIAFNCAQCTSLTPEYVNRASGLELHRFNWIPDEKIGSLPLEWNHLVGEYERIERPRILHWTLGGPWFPEYRSADYADEWFATRDRMLGETVAVRA